MKSKLLYQSPEGQRAFVLVFDAGDEVIAGLIRNAVKSLTC